MSSLLSGKTAVVTGGASGNGRAIALTFAEHGADVVVADVRSRPRDGGTPTHEVIDADTDARSTFVDCDVSDVDDLRAAVDAADAFGDLDVMVNNAGVLITERFLDATEEDFSTVMDVNVKGVYFGTQVAAEKMIAHGGGGSVINMSSIAGLHGSSRFILYSTSKGAVRLATYSLADELGQHGIRVNAIHPGLIETRMATEDSGSIGTELEEGNLAQIPLGQVGQPEDVGNAALFLASPLASYVSAASLVVDGGMYNTA